MADLQDAVRSSRRRFEEPAREARQHDAAQALRALQAGQRAATPTASGRASATWSGAPSGTPGTASRARRATRRSRSTSTCRIAEVGGAPASAGYVLLGAASSSPPASCLRRRPRAGRAAASRFSSISASISAAKAPSRRPSRAVRSNESASTTQAAVDAGARELDDVARLAFDHGALHAELLLGRLGPLPGGLARLGQAEAMCSRWMWMSAMAAPSGGGSMSRAQRSSAARRSAARQRGQPPDLGVEAREVAALALEQLLERRHQAGVAGEHAERRRCWPARTRRRSRRSRSSASPSAPRSSARRRASTAALRGALGGVACGAARRGASSSSR